jgi:hypothetical protein
MFIDEYAKSSPIPKRILRYLNRINLIADPLLADEIIALQFLSQIWGNREVIRAQLNRLSLKSRLSFLKTAHIPTKWERYAYSRFSNLESGKTLPMETLIEEIQTTLCFLLKQQHISRLYKVRNRVQVARHRKKNKLANC